MAYPSATDYDCCIENYDSFVISDLLRGGKPVKNSDGKLLLRAGGFCKVYKVEVDKTIALRCWLIEPHESAEKRFQVTKEYIENFRASRPGTLRYFVDYQFDAKGIRFSEVTYPILSMEWVEGKELSEYIDTYINDSHNIKGLADKFLQMIRDLHEAKISHGDLQDGNIMVTESGDLRLVDYDSLYISDLGKIFCPTFGVDTFQHKNRFKEKYGDLRLDYFSELLIYLSLLAYAEKPDLWKKHTQDRLLFSKEDLTTPQSSEVFCQLKQMGESIAHYASVLANYCELEDLKQCEPLEKLLKVNVWPKKISSRMGTSSSASLSISETPWPQSSPTPITENQNKTEPGKSPITVTSPSITLDATKNNSPILSNTIIIKSAASNAHLDWFDKVKQSLINARQENGSILMKLGVSGISFGLCSALIGMMIGSSHGFLYTDHNYFPGLFLVLLFIINNFFYMHLDEKIKNKIPAIFVLFMAYGFPLLLFMLSFNHPQFLQLSLSILFSLIVYKFLVQISGLITLDQSFLTPFAYEKNNLYALILGIGAMITAIVIYDIGDPLKGALWFGILGIALGVFRRFLLILNGLPENL